MQDPKDREIARLKMTIAAFKKYDNKRKAFIQKLQEELESLSQQYVDLKNSVPKDIIEVENDYKEKLKNLRANVSGNAKKIEHLNRLLKLADKDCLERAEEVLKQYTILQLKEANDKLQKEVQLLRNTNKELVMRINRLNQQEKNQ